MPTPNALAVAKWYETSKKRNHPDVKAYLDHLEPKQRRLAQELRSRIKAMDPDIKEGIAWATPFFFRRAPLCYISVAKTHVNLGFPLGAEFTNRTGLTGTGKSAILKTKLKLDADVPAEFDAWMRQALALDDLQDPC